jgi:hypothetical protein
MQNEFLPYDRALKLKQLGFDEEDFGRFYTKPKSKMFGIDEKGRHYPIKNTSKKLYTVGEDFVLNDDDVIVAPLFQQAFRWFREEYGLLTYVGSRTLDNGDTIYIPNGRTVPDTVKNGFIVDNLTYATKKTYEEAELACLDKLIEIVELNQQKNESNTD